MKLTKRIANARIMGAAVLAVSALLTVRADYQSTVLSQGPAGYWRLQETTTPGPPVSASNSGSLGSAADGSYAAYPFKGIAGALGGSDTGVSFDGLSQWITVPYNAALNPAIFTIEAWLKPAAFQPQGNLDCVLASMHADVAARAGWLIYQSGGPTDTAAPGWQLRMYGQNGSATSLRLLLACTNIVSGTWYHVAFTFDGTTAKCYLNGVYQDQATPDPHGFVPNPDGNFTIGTRSDNAFPWAGVADEVAYYGAALTDAQIKAHYDTAISAPANYPTVIQGDAPLAYYRLDEAPDAPAANLGTLGAAGNGAYVSPVTPGQTGARPPAFPGMTTDNVACGLDGTGGFVNLPPLYLKSARATITAWIKPSGIQTTNAAIVFSRAGNTIAGLKFDVSDPNGLSYNWNGDTVAANFASGLAVPADQWSFVAMVVQPDLATLCLGTSTDFNTSANYDATPAEQDFAGCTRIGSDSSGTNLTFNGLIDEVAIFNRTLGIGEVYSQYADAVGGKAPQIFVHPQSPVDPLFTGDTFTLSVDAGGSATVKYQWRKGGVNVPGATSSTYTKTNADPTLDSGNYDVVVSNGFGSVTSAPAAVSIQSLFSPSITEQPAGRSVLYANGAWTLKVGVVGGAITYRWQKGGVDIPGATNATYVINPAQSGDSGDYQVIVSNRLGSQTSSTATVLVTVPETGSYGAAVAADFPEAWWRLDETAGTDMFDAMGRHDGFYQPTVTLGAAGAVRGSDTAVSFTGSSGGYGEVPYSAALNTTDFSLECWVKTTNLGQRGAVVSTTSSSEKGCYFWTYSGAWVGGVGASAAWYYVPSTTPPATMQSNQWVHLVLTYSSSSSMRFYVNGQWDGNGYVNFDRNTSGALRIGARGLTASTVDMQFDGVVDEVAVYTKALTTNQIMAHYIAGRYGNSAPVFVAQPVSGTAIEGTAFSFTAQAEGPPTITLQWQKDGTPIPNATNATYTIAKATYADAGTYKVVATNSNGSTESASATLIVVPPPAFCNLTDNLVLHLGFDGNCQDSSGRNNNGTPQGNPSFTTPGMIGSQALHYSTVTDTSTTPPTVTAANYVTLGQPADLQFGTSQNFSVAFWVRLPNGALPGDLPFFGNAVNSYMNWGYLFAPSYNKGGWSWCLGAQDGTYVGLYGPADTINDGQWHHLAFTFDRAGNGVTYLDGVQVDSRPASNTDLDSGNDTCIGQDPTGLYPEAGEADIDDLAVWRRVLTPAEAACICTVGQTYGRSFDTYGPVSLTVRSTPTQVQLIWQAGTLQETDSVKGTWKNVTGATAPYFTVSPGAGVKLYRVQL